MKTLTQISAELRGTVSPDYNQLHALADAIDAHLSQPQPVAQGEAMVVTLAEAERVAQHAYVAGKRGYTFTGFVAELRSAAAPTIPTVRRVVPVEPTEEMVLAAAKSVSGEWDDESADVKTGLLEIQRAALRDAIAASPSAGGA
jgi:hypothetical protein